MIAPVSPRELADPLPQDAQDRQSGATMYDAIHRPTTHPKLYTRDGNPMNVPPLITAAVRATARELPSDRFPRKVLPGETPPSGSPPRSPRSPGRARPS